MTTDWRPASAPSDYEAALVMTNPYSSLWQSVRGDLHDRGVGRDEIIGKLDCLRLAFRDSGRGEDEDIVSDVLDSVYGYAPARSRL